MKLCLLAVVLPCILAAPSFVLDLMKGLQTEVEKGKPVDEIFRSFKIVFDKRYEEGEEEIRLKIFQQNLKYITDHNLRYARNETTFYLGVNQFSDLTHTEFLALYTTKIDLQDMNMENSTTFLPPLNVELPSSVDWRTKGYVTPVKNQGQCGSCWAFSSTGSLEGQHYRKTKKMVSLSEQQLVDCSTRFGNQGCNGGWQYKAFEYIKAAGGIEGERDYPYTGRQGTCRFNRKYVRATVTGYVKLPRGSESGLQKAVASQGPISVSIDASHPSFQSYRGGVYYEPSCSQTRLDHAVLVVGYGTESHGDYWIVKNSWSAGWGEQGYIRMARNRGNNCGIATGAIYPTV